MGRRETAALGGLLRGVGKTFSDRSQNRLDEERERRKDAHDLLRDKREHKHQRGLLASTEVDEQGNVIAITRGGETSKLGFKGQATRAPGALTDAQIQKDAKDRYTTDSITEGEVVDWKSVDAYLAAKGRPDLAAPRGIAGDTSIDKNSDEWLSAEKDAEKWAKDQERFWSLDTTVFEQYGGETQAIRDKTMEYYLADKGVAAGGTKQPSGGTKPTVSGTKPSGSGTRASPYKPTTQQEFDQIKAGEYFIDPDDGQPYTK